MASKSRSGSWGALATEPDLLQGVAAQAQPQGLERDHLVRRDVAEIHGRPDVLDEPDLRGLRRRFEDHVGELDVARDLAYELGAHLAVRREDAGGAALACLGDHLPGAGVQLLAKPPRPL